LINKKTIPWLLLAAVIISGALITYKKILQSFLPKWEGFSATPYWDYKQWSWGYGTKVPGSVPDRSIKPPGSINRAKAFSDALFHVEKDYKYLSALIKVPLNANQWAALLSFSYNLGTGNADNLVKNINERNTAALENQWKQYVNAGGQPLEHLIKRRAAEWAMWIKN